jgi:putative ABC transport system substrate-binding protein
MLDRPTSRRAFIAGLSSAAAWPLVARGQQVAPKRPQRIVILSPVVNPVFDAFRARLRELGHSEGGDVVLNFRTAGGHVDRLPPLAREIVAEGAVDIIVAESTPAATAALQATKTIPIVAYVAVDPVVAGLATSLAHPGGNVTGIAFLAAELNAKRVELLHQILPGAQRVAAISFATSSPVNSPGNLRAAEEAAQKLSLAIETITINDPSALHDALSPEALVGFDGFIVLPDVVLTSLTPDLVALLGASRKPAVYPNRIQAVAGGLLSYAQDVNEGYKHLASQVDRVLKGEKPADIPFERPTKFVLVINLRTARSFGIQIPAEILVRADEVIE